VEGEFEDKIKIMFAKKSTSNFINSADYKIYIKNIVKVIEFCIFNADIDLTTCSMVSIKNFFPSMN